MIRHLSGLLTAFTLVTVSVFALPAVANIGNEQFAGEADSRLWRFKVSLNDREIGRHDFLVSGKPNEKTVRISADFDVKILFINAYSYYHENTETWKDGCLQQIESETDDNGDLLKVVGGSTSDGFLVETNSGNPRTISSECVRSFAYWNPSFLESKQLLNSQTGKLVDVVITGEGEDTLSINGTTIAAMRYEISMEEGPITLWYTRDTSEWLALEAETGGRTLRYEPVELPFSRNRESIPLAKR